MAKGLAVVGTSEAGTVVGAWAPLPAGLAALRESQAQPVAARQGSSRRMHPWPQAFCSGLHVRQHTPPVRSGTQAASPRGTEPVSERSPRPKSRRRNGM